MRSGRGGAEGQAAGRPSGRGASRWPGRRGRARAGWFSGMGAGLVGGDMSPARPSLPRRVAGGWRAAAWRGLARYADPDGRLRGGRRLRGGAGSSASRGWPRRDRAARHLGGGSSVPGISRGDDPVGRRARARLRACPHCSPTSAVSQRAVVSERERMAAVTVRPRRGPSGWPLPGHGGRLPGARASSRRGGGHVRVLPGSTAIC